MRWIVAGQGIGLWFHVLLVVRRAEAREVSGVAAWQRCYVAGGAGSVVVEWAIRKQVSSW